MVELHQNIGKRPENEQMFHRGRVETISGCMFSGKSEELIRRLRRFKIAGIKFQVFKPVIDDRRGDGTINTYKGKDSFPAKPVVSSKELLDSVENDTLIVAIDEGQFFDMNLPLVTRELASRGKRVIVAGLDTDFRGKPFGPMPEIILDAEESQQLRAVCIKCKAEDDATRTQRMKIKGGERVPAHYNDPVVQVGEEEYEARCRHCHEVPGAPTIIDIYISEDK